MGQGEILRILSMKNEWLSANQIAESLNVGYSCTIVKLRKMRQREDLQYKKIGNKIYYKI